MPTHLYLAPAAAGKTAYVLARARDASRDLAAVPRLSSRPTCRPAPRGGAWPSGRGDRRARAYLRSASTLRCSTPRVRFTSN